MRDKPTLGCALPPVPINACWMPGPVNGDDPAEKDLIEVGDRFLVLVHCVYMRGTKQERDFWDAHIIVATETGWDNANDVLRSCHAVCERQITSPTQSTNWESLHTVVKRTLEEQHKYFYPKLDERNA